MSTLTQAIRNTKRRQFEKTHKEVKEFLLPDLNLMTETLVKVKLEELTAKNQELENELAGARKSFETHIKAIDGILGQLDQKKLNVEQFQAFGGEVKQAIGKIQLIPGTSGPKGEKGDIGPKPIAGVDYPIPRDGRDGRDGERGDTGFPGKNGQDGSPDTPEQIADKINTLEEKIEQKTIKGLLSLIRNLQNSIREKKSSGGGMGNWQHETKNVSSSTTSISTDYKVAANGAAAMLYYQGQLLVKDTAYTVGGDRKTHTLLFTPVNSTFIDVVYVRA